MNTARDCMHSLSPWMVACLGLGLCLVDAGCSGISGLRSVGTERPSLLSFWDRQGPGSPTPENDSYAQAMRPSRARAEAIAKRDDAAAVDGDQRSRRHEASSSPTRPSRHVVPTRTSATNLDGSERSGFVRSIPNRYQAFCSPTGGEREPAARRGGPLASWKAEKAESSLDSGPPLSPPADGDRIKNQAPSVVAESEQVAGPGPTTKTAKAFPERGPGRASCSRRGASRRHENLQGEDLPARTGQRPASARRRHPAIDQARSQGRSVGMVERAQQGARGHLFEHDRPADDLRSHAGRGHSTSRHEDPRR